MLGLWQVCLPSLHKMAEICSDGGDFGSKSSVLPTIATRNSEIL